MEYLKVRKTDLIVEQIFELSENFVNNLDIIENSQVYYIKKSYFGNLTIREGDKVDITNKKVLSLTKENARPSSIVVDYYSRIEQLAKKKISEILLDDIFFPHRPEQIETIRLISRIVQKAKNRFYDLSIKDTQQSLERLEDVFSDLHEELTEVKIVNAPGFYFGDKLAPGELLLPDDQGFPMTLFVQNPIADSGLCSVVEISPKLRSIIVTRLAHDRNKIIIQEFEDTLKITARNLCGPSSLILKRTLSKPQE